jgi:2-polyprenyl-6-hydroxyphenyl methylase/3-demethylubiquinone-9 3-methyltransferase
VNAASCEAALDAIQYHDRLAIDWERRYQKASFRARLIAVAECLDGKYLSGTEWLDAGCGTGTLSRWLAERGCSVLGVDAAPRMIASAAMLANSGFGPGSLRFQCVETISHLALDKHSVDGILCSSVLEYVSDPDACLAEFARVLRPGGILVISVPSTYSIIRRAQITCNLVGRLLGKNWVTYLNHSKHQYSRSKFERILKSHDFRSEKVLAFGGPLPRWIQRTHFGGSLLMFVARKV